MKAKNPTKKSTTKKSSKKDKVIEMTPIVSDDFIKAIAKMKADKEKKNVKVSPTIDTSGAVIMKSVDDPGETSTGKVVKVTPHLDTDTGVVTMIPDEE